MRSGVIAQKVGMTRVYTEAGEHVPVTVLRVDNCQVVAQRTAGKGRLPAVQLGVGPQGQKHPEGAPRPFRQGEVEPKRKVAEFRVSPENLIDVGAEITADHFIPGQFVDVTGTSIGKGFAGVMKRHNFGGVRATHGDSVSHRSHGSTGQRQDPGKVFKGKKMAGHMGDVRVTTQNLQVVATDADRGLIMVRGAVPGAKGGWILVRDAVKRPLPNDVPTPAAIRAAQPAASSRPKRRPRGEPDGTPGQNAGRREAGTVTLSDEIFGLEPRADILQRMVRWQLKRQPGTHKTKGRSEMQGRAKMYSRRAPAVPVTATRRRRSSAAAARLRPGRAQPCDRSAEEGARAGAEACAVGQGQGASIIVVDELVAEAKTKAARGAVRQARPGQCADHRRRRDRGEFRARGRQHPEIDVLPIQGINVYDILRRDTLVLTKAAVEALEERFK